MHRAPFVILLAATSAAAAPDTLEGAQRELGLSDFSLGTGGFHASAFAQLAGGTSDQRAEGTVATGAALRVSAPECEIVTLGGQARLGVSNDGVVTRQMSAENWASGCIHITPVTIELGHHLEWDVRPSLLAPIGLRPGANRRETITLRLEMLRIPLGALAIDATAPGDLVLFDVDVKQTFLWSRGGPIAMHGLPEAVPFRYARRHTAPWGEQRDFRVDVGAGGGEFTDDGASVHIWGLRLSNLAIGPVYTTGGIGIASASAGMFVSQYERQVDLTTPRAELGVETGGKHLHGFARAIHEASIVPDGYATIDSRLTAGLHLDVTGTRVALEAAFGRTRIYVPGEIRRSELTGGTSLSAARELGHHLQATLQLDLARSFYAAAAESAALVDARWGIQAIASLQAAVGR